MKPLAECRLYTFVDTAYLHGRKPEDVARALCDGGSDIIQLRAKDAPADEVRRLAETILPVTNAAGVGLVINDHPQIAHQVGAFACHLGQEDFLKAAILRRRRCGDVLRVSSSASTHAPEQAQRALLAGPDYIAIGPIYPTGTKPTAKPVTLDYVRWAAANVTLPWFAIGGVNLQTLDDVLAAGATRICVVSAILNAPDVAEACLEYRRRLG